MASLDKLLETVSRLKSLAEQEKYQSFIDGLEDYRQLFEKWSEEHQGKREEQFAPKDRQSLELLQEQHMELVTLAEKARDSIAQALRELHGRATAIKSYASPYKEKKNLTGTRRG